MTPPQSVLVGPTRVALAGFGTIGQDVARRLHAGAIPGLQLSAVSARDLQRAKTTIARLQLSPLPAIVTIEQLPRYAEVIVECANHDAFPAIAKATLNAGRILVPLSVGALVSHPDIIELARQRRGLIRIASGALPGLDSVRIAAEGTINSVKLTNRTHPRLLAEEPYLVENGIDLSRPLSQPLCVFKGSASDAARFFPRHLNIAVALSLAGIGLDRTEVEIWADQAVPGPVITVEVDADDATFELTGHNFPTATNPRTSRIVSLSVIAALRSLVESVQIGS